MEDRGGGARRAGDPAGAPAPSLLAAAEELTAAVRDLSHLAASRLKALNERETLQLAGLVEHAHRRLDAIAVRVTGDIEEKAIADHVGARSTVSLLQQRLRVGAPEAKRRLTLAAALHPAAALTGQVIAPAWPATADAFGEGRISGDHARVLLQNLDIIAEKAQSAGPALDGLGGGLDGGDGGLDGEIFDTAAVEAHLLRQALDYDPAFVDRCGKRWIDHLDPDGSLPSEAQSARDHGLFIGRPMKSGLVPFRGAMSQEQHETLLTAIQPATNPRHGGGLGTGAGTGADSGRDGVAGNEAGNGVLRNGAAAGDTGGAGIGAPGDGGAERDLDSRTHQRKLLDGLIGVCAAALGSGEVRGDGGRPTVLVTIDHRTLLGQLNDSATFAHTGPVSPSVARRLACDAGIIPVVLGGRGQILDVGRQRRLFTAPQRKAIIARDGGCVFPGCTAPPSWCACHHIEFYSRGGPTSVENGCLLCEHHHAVVHREEWEIVMRDGRPWLVPPWWVDPRQQPRLNHFHRPPGPARPEPRIATGAGTRKVPAAREVSGARRARRPREGTAPRAESPRGGAAAP